MRNVGKLLAIGLVLVASMARAIADSEVANGPVHEGVEVQIDLPPRYRQPNAEGTDGAGCCVFASLQMAARWMGIEELADLFEWIQTQKGGGWPERVEKVLKERAPHLSFIQYEGADVAILDAAMATGRPVCLTYGYGEFYKKRGMAKISHMVLLVHLDRNKAAILDNNDVENVTWMTREELIKRAKYPSGNLWAVVLIGTPPPPIPKNL